MMFSIRSIIAVWLEKLTLHQECQVEEVITFLRISLIIHLTVIKLFLKHDKTTKIIIHNGIKITFTTQIEYNNQRAIKKRVRYGRAFLQSTASRSSS